MGPILELLEEDAEVVALIKPQFEAGREKVGKKGVVRDPAVHKEVLDDFVALTKEIGFKILGLTFSPVKGPEGNIEYLLHLKKACRSCRSLPLTTATKPIIAPAKMW